MDSRKLDLEKENRWIVDALFAKIRVTIFEKTSLHRMIQEKKKKKKMIHFKI